MLRTKAPLRAPQELAPHVFAAVKTVSVLFLYGLLTNMRNKTNSLIKRETLFLLRIM